MSGLQASLSRPSRPPAPQPPQMQQHHQLQHPRNNTHGHLGLPPRVQAPPPMNLAILGGTPSASTTAGPASISSLREHADRMMQQQRADAKNKEDLTNQLRVKEGELQRLSNALSSQTSRNSELEARLTQGDAQMQELFEKMTQLTTMHNTLLEGVHKSTQGLKENKEGAVALDALAKGQDLAIQDLLQKYEVLVAEKNELTAQFQEVNTRARDARSRLAHAQGQEKKLQTELDQAISDANEMRKQLVEMRSRLSELESEVLATAHKLSQANAHTENEVSAARFEAERRASKQISQMQCEKAAKEGQLAVALASVKDFKADLEALEAERGRLSDNLQASRKHEDELKGKLASECAHTQELQRNLQAAEKAFQNLQLEHREVLAKLQETSAKCAGLESELAAGTAAQQKLQDKLMAEETSRQESVDKAVGALSAAKIELESQVQILSKKVEEVEAQAKVAQQKLTDANVQAAKEQEKLQKQLDRAMEAEERAKEELAVCKEAAEQAEAAFAARLEGHTSTSAKIQVQKAVEQNNKQAQKALDDAKRKSAAELKKAQTELKDLQTAVTAAQQQAAEAQAALAKEEARSKAALQEALEKAKAEKLEAIAVAAVQAKEVQPAYLARSQLKQGGLVDEASHKFKAELALQAKKAADDLKAERDAWEKKLKVESALLGAKATEQLESLKLELAKKAAQDLHSIAEELAAIHEQMDKGKREHARQAEAVLLAELDERSARVGALEVELHAQQTELVDLRQQLVAASEAPKAGLEAQHKAEQNALALARLREEMTVTERDLRDTRKQLELQQRLAQDLRKKLGEKEQLPQAAVGGQLMLSKSRQEHGAIQQSFKKPLPPRFPAEERIKDPRRYADVDDTDNESEGGRAPSTQGGAGGIFGLFKGSTPQHYKQPAPKRVKVDAPPSSNAIAAAVPDLRPSESGKRSLFGAMRARPSGIAGSAALPKPSNTDVNRSAPAAHPASVRAGAKSGGATMLLPKEMPEGGKKSANSTKARGGSRLKSLSSQPGAGSKSVQVGLGGLFDGN